MTDKPAKHGVDAHLPSDSEQFENKVVEMKAKMTPEQEKFDKEMNETIERLNAFARFSMENEVVIATVDGKEHKGSEFGLGRDALLLQLYIQSELNYATMTALATYAIEKLEIPDGRLMADTKKIVDKNLFDKQQQYGILITKSGVTQVTSEGN